MKKRKPNFPFKDIINDLSESMTKDVNFITFAKICKDVRHWPVYDSGYHVKSYIKNDWIFIKK